MKRSAIGVTVAMLGGIALGTAGCNSCDSSRAAPDAGSDAAQAVAAPAASDTESVDDAIRPVYPIDDKPALPLAEKYCATVRELPKKRRDACCPQFGSYAPTDQCVRTLSSALRSGAVTIDGAALDGCVAGMTRATSECDWVVATANPSAQECWGVLKGTLQAGAACRSNLECDEGLRCLGLGATHPGKCTPPMATGSACRLAVDSLAVFTNQDDVDRHHPECAGWCRVRQCFDATPIGGACKASEECGPKGWCAAGKCAASLPAAGQPCTDACGAGARCVSGACVAPKAGGAACASDAECRGVCERDGDASAGRCAGRCPSFPLPKK